MDKALALLLLLLSPISVFSQGILKPILGGTVQLSPGWTFVQDHINLGCTVGNAGCSGLMYPTQPGTVWVVFVSTSNNLTISSVTGGSATWNLCGSSACHAFTTSIGGVDAAYAFNGNSGSTSYSINLSGTTTGSVFYAEFVELLPPAGTSASYDTASAVINSSCSTSCNTAGLTLTAGYTDAVVQITNAPALIALSGPFAYASTYTATGSGSGLALNVTSAPATTFGLDPLSHGGSSWLGVVGIAFKTTAGQFITPQFTWANFATTYTLNASGHLSCTPSCTSFTIPSTTSGNLAFLQASDGSGRTISSISDGTNTWTIPSGSNTCQISNAVGALSCAYVLSLGPGVTSLIVTMSGNSSNVAFAYYEMSRTSGSWALDAQGATLNPTSTNVPGQSLQAGCSGCSGAATGTLDVIFSASEIGGGPDGFRYYPYPCINKGNNSFGGGYTFDRNYADTGLLMNTPTVPTAFGTGPSNQSNVTAIAFK